MIPVGWLDPSQDCWDSNLIRLLLDGEIFPHGLKVRHHAGYPNVDGPVCLIVPGRYYAQHADQINESIKRFVSVLMVVTSDEEGSFPIGRITHPRLKVWVQTPRENDWFKREYPAGTRFLGVGFPPHFNAMKAAPPTKDLDLFLSAQQTHVRRVECFTALRHRPEGISYSLAATDGFTKGMEPDKYMSHMSRARVAPCPSGAVSPDSFRLWEALEAHAVPIADAVSPVDGKTDYWERVCPGAPFPVLTDYADLPGYIEDVLRGWPANANCVTAWWMQYKRGLARGLREDLEALGAVKPAV